MSATEFRYFLDIGYAVRVTLSDSYQCCYSAKVYEVFDHTPEHPSLLEAGSRVPCGTDDESKASVFAECTLGKWDGCTNWRFTDDCWHACSIEGVRAIGEAMVKVCEMAHNLMLSVGEHSEILPTVNPPELPDSSQPFGCSE